MKRTSLSVAIIISSLVGAIQMAGAQPINLTPYTNCVTYDAQAQLYTAYFGYNNASGNSVAILVGDDNQVFPASPFQGQPTTFNVGNYPRVFTVRFDPVITPTVTWLLNGFAASASSSTPACVSSVTAPASAVSRSAATLNGVVVPDGIDTTYHFEYGTTSALGQSSAVQDAGAGTAPILVQTTLSGLSAATTYYFRLDTTNAFDTTTGPLQSFTTAAEAPLTIVTTTLGAGQVGQAYTASLTAAGGTPPYHWAVTGGALPAGLTLDATTGAITGTPTSAGTASFSVSVTDAAGLVATGPLSVVIQPAAPTGPLITKLVPTRANEFSLVLIEGSGLATGNAATLFPASDATVRFGNRTAVVLLDTPTQILAIAPPGRGTVDVTVSVGGRVSPIVAADRFTYP